MSTDVIAPGRLLKPSATRRACRGAAAILAVGLLATLIGAGPAPRPAPAGSPTLEALRRGGSELAHRFESWYRRTPAMERIAWGGLVACAVLGLVVTVERTARVRRSRIIPEAFVERFQRRLGEGGLERGKALDYCELNPSPAARVALAAVRRWGRTTTDLERGVALARQVEVDRLRRNLGTLRRVAAMAPLVGLLGTLAEAGRILSTLGPGTAWGPLLAGALAPLTGGVALAVVALLAFDGLTVRVEGLAADLERIGAETIDAVALAAPLPVVAAIHPSAAPSKPLPAAGPIPQATHRPSHGHGPGHPGGVPGRAPHALRFPNSRKIEGR